MINIVLPAHWNYSHWILCCSLLVFWMFTSRSIDIPSRDRRVTSSLSSNYQRLPLQINFRHNSFSNIPFWFSNMPYMISQAVWMWLAMVIADSFMIMWITCNGLTKVLLMNLDVNVCKNQHWVCNICSEEFQCAGRTIFINQFW